MGSELWPSQAAVYRVRLESTLFDASINSISDQSVSIKKVVKTKLIIVISEMLSSHDEA